MDFCLALILYARYSYFKCAPIIIAAIILQITAKLCLTKKGQSKLLIYEI